MTAAFLDPFGADAAAPFRAAVPYDVRLGGDRPTRAMYVRRRLIVALLLTALSTVVAVAVHTVLADRGGVPASIPAVQPATGAGGEVAQLAGSAALTGPVALTDAAASGGVGASGIVATTPATYIVQPGDTLWSIAERVHGRAAVADYVDLLVSANGGASVQAGQLLNLP